MFRYDATSASVFVFTKKEGLLSSVAHDLKLRVAKFQIQRDGDQILAKFDAHSLEVVAAIHDENEDANLLSSASVHEIEENIRRKVLAADAFPEITFEASVVSDTEVRGRLTLAGVTREIAGHRNDEAMHFCAEFVIHQTDFGVKPFRAMMGALKIHPDVRVIARIPKNKT